MPQNAARRWWQLLLLIHLIAYSGFFIIALSNFNYVWYISQNNFIILLFWLPLLLIHVGVHSYHTGRGDISKLERQAYREGLADAMQQTGQRDKRTERLMVDDEGELVELVEKRKR